MSLIVNIPLCALAYFLVEKRYAVRSLVFTLVYSFSYLYLQTTGLDLLKYNAGGALHHLLFCHQFCGQLYHQGNQDRIQVYRDHHPSG